MLDKLHADGIHVCLNLHPADGVHPHEAAYENMARHMGIDPATKQPVKFDITDPRFIEGYFSYLHHPLEEQGVDFWWIDWQQETNTKVKGLDPLWCLNHLHSLDISRDGGKRPMTFSRWGGAGSHRYPIGFAGDICRTWNSLKYGISYAPLCSNVGYGWYSPDIGGFARGPNDDELLIRWMQHGVWSPIFRLHNCGDPTLDYRPWSKDGAHKRAGIAALQLRRALVPYINNQNFTHSLGGLPLVRPMYYSYDSEEATRWPYQFLFGGDLLVAPVDAAADADLQLSRKVLWLPEGTWFEYFTGAKVSGDRYLSRYCGIEDYPVYVRDGAIIPLAGREPDAIELLIFPCTNAGCALVVDDGVTMEYQGGKYDQWKFESRYADGILTIRAKREHAGLGVEKRLDVRLRGFDTEDVVLPAGVFSGDTEFRFEVAIKTPPVRSAQEQMLAWLKPLRIDSHFARPLCDNADAILEDLRNLRKYVVDLKAVELRYLVERIAGVGSHAESLPDGSRYFVWWNPDARNDFAVAIALREEWMWNEVNSGLEQSHGSYLWNPKSHYSKFRMRSNYFGLGEFVEDGSPMGQT